MDFKSSRVHSDDRILSSITQLISKEQKYTRIQTFLNIYLSIPHNQINMGIIFWKCGTDRLQNPQEDEPSSFFDFKVRDLQGNFVHFSSFQDKKAILVVNVASKCKLTFKNYKALTKMHNQLSEKGFEVLAFPCNQFFSQQNGSHEQILKFAKHTFGTKFSFFEKIDVNGPKTHPVYKYLRNRSSLYNQQSKTAGVIPWNFSKFLLNSQGEVVRYFDPYDDLEEIQVEVQALL